MGRSQEDLQNQISQLTQENKNKENPQILSWSPLNTFLEGILILLIEH